MNVKKICIFILILLFIFQYANFIKQRMIELRNKDIVHHFATHITLSDREVIPRVIHRVWLGSTFPEKYRSALEATAKANPSFEQKIWNDEMVNRLMNEVYSNHPIYGDRVKKAYYSINPKYGAARADMARYAIVCAKGGVYIDCKSSSKDLLPILSKARFVCSFWPEGSTGFPHAIGEIQNCWFASEAEHPTLHLVIDRVLQNIANYKRRGPLERYICENMNAVYDCKAVLLVTGPVPFTVMVKKSDPKWGVRILETSGVIKEDHLGTHTYGSSYRKRCEPLILTEEEQRAI